MFQSSYYNHKKLLVITMGRLQAQEVFGPDIELLKGSSTTKEEAAVRTDYIGNSKRRYADVNSGRRSD